jgi:hypothetical protein
MYIGSRIGHTIEGVMSFIAEGRNKLPRRIFEATSTPYNWPWQKQI